MTTLTSATAGRPLRLQPFIPTEDSSMRTLLTCLLVVLALLNAAASRADAQTAFAKMRSLVGEWHAPLPNDETMVDIFRPIAFGTALLHEEWKNGEQLTATVFYVVGNELRADHYCDMGNQLHYVDESDDPQVLRWVLKDAKNLDTHPQHFHSTTWRYVDAEHHVQDWEAMSPGKPSKTIRMDFTRVAAANIDPQAVVRADVQALNDGNAATLLSLFAADARIFRTSQDPDRLTGDLSEKMGTQDQRKAFFSEMLARRPLSRVQLLDMVAAGDLVATKLQFTNPDGSPPGYVLAIYRVRDGLIQDLWHLASSAQDDAAASRAAEEVIARFGDANNRGDVEAFLGLFSPSAKNFRSSGNAHALGDKPSVKIVDEKTRREAYVKMFANGAPAQVQTLGTVALNDMIVVSETATLPTGKVADEMSVYRIANGRIERDWFVFDQLRP
jgi:hypothetical protein